LELAQRKRRSDRRPDEPLLQPKGITVVRAAFKNGCLQILLESAQVPNQQALVAFVDQGLTCLEAACIKQVKLYGRQTGEEFPAWSQE